MRYFLLLLGPGLVVGILVFLKFTQISLLMAKGEEAARAYELGPVDRVVDRLLEGDLARSLERRAGVIERDERRGEKRLEEELPAGSVDAVLLG